MQTKILVLVNWHVVETNVELPNVNPNNYHVKGTDYYYVKNWPIEKSVEIYGIGNNYFSQKIEKNFLRFYFIQTLKVIFKIQKYDIIISHGAQSGLFLALIRTLFGLKKAKHVIIDIGGFQGAGTNRFNNKIISFAIRSVDKFIVHSSSLIEYYQIYFPEIVNRSKFIKLGIDYKYFENFKISEESNIKNEIICLGYSFRDWGTLIKAYENLNLSNLKLKIIGNTSLNIKNNNIILKPYIPIDELVKELKNCKFVVIPLFETTYSYGQLSVLEPMSLGKAVITSNVTNIAEYIVDGKNGLLYEKQNVDSLTDKMKLLIENSDLINQIGNNAKINIKQNLSFEKMQLEMFSFIMGN